MNPFKLRDMVAKATRKVRDGSLGDATQAIQQTLNRMSIAREAVSQAYKVASLTAELAREQTRSARNVIDVEARVVPDDDVATTAERETVDAPSGPTAPSPASTKPAQPGRGRFIDGTFTEAAATRPYKLFIPDGHAGALPLVVMLHGCTQDPADFAAGTGMNDVAQAQGFLVLYPAQPQRANASKCWNWFEASHQLRGSGEPAFIAALTQRIAKDHAVDASRVYVAGLSAGGAMASLMGTLYPDIYAAVGVHSGLPSGAARDMPSAFAAMKGGGAAPAGRLPPTIVFHGDRDTTVNPVNGQRVIQIAAGAAASRPAAVEQGQVPHGHAYTRSRHVDAEGRVVAEQWLVHGAAHAWSGGHASGSYTDSRGPDASREMVRFFLDHPLATQGAPHAAAPSTA